MSKMSETFYDLLEMLEQGYSDQEIADELGFSVEAIAVWRADAALLPELPFEELNTPIQADEQEDIYVRLRRDDPDADHVFADFYEDQDRYDLRGF